MEIPNGGELPPESTVIFHVSGSRVRPVGGPCTHIDADGLNCHDDGISVTWVEFFGSADDPLQSAALAMKGAITFRASGVVARTNVGKLVDELSADNVHITVIRDQIPGNDGHCLITGIEKHEIPKLMMLAKQIDDFIPNGDIEGLIQGKAGR